MTEAAARANSWRLNGWERWGWVFGAVWLVFLYFPIRAIFESDVAVWVMVAALGGILAFAVLFVWEWIPLLRDDMPTRAPLRGFVLLSVIAGLEIWVIGIEAAAMAPFLVSFAMFAFRWPHAAIIAGVIVVVSLVALGIWGSGDLDILAVILVVVYVFTLMGRGFENASAQRSAMEQQLLIAEERDRVARDVHDLLGQTLTAISAKSELAERVLDVDPERTRGQLREVQELARQGLIDVRATISGLRTPTVRDELVAARVALESAGIHTDVRVEADASEREPHPVLAWALREAVTNVVRHSGAQRCELEIGMRSIVVRDDGNGAHGPEGHGLRGLRERVRAVGGTVRAGVPAGGKGHEVEVSVA